MLRARREISSPHQFWLWNSLVALAYFGAGKLGHLLAMPGTAITAIWPPAGIALVAILVYGWRTSPGIWVGAFSIGYSGLLKSGNHLPDLEGLFAGMLMATGSTLGALAAGYGLRRLVRRRPDWRNVSHTGWLFLIGATANLINASIGTAGLCSFGQVPTTAAAQVWLTWWLGDTLGVFVFAPFLLSFTQPEPAWAKPRHAEALGVIGLTMTATYLIFWDVGDFKFSIRPDDFLLLPFLTWAALRLGIRHTCTLLVLVSGLVVMGTAHGSGPYAQPALADALLKLSASLSLGIPTILMIAVATQERRRLEQELHLTNQGLEQQILARTGTLARLAAIVQSSDDAIITKSLNGLITSWNPGAEKMHGYSAAEMLGKPIKLLMPPERENAEDALLTAVCQGQETAHFKAQRRRKDGTLFHAEVTAFAIRDAEGKILGGATITRDITRRHQAEVAARESQDRLELAVKAAGIGYWDADLTSDTVHYSPEWKLQLGYAAEELPGNFGLWRSLLHPEDRAAAETRVADYLAGRIPTYAVEFRLRHKDGSYRWIYSRGQLLNDQQGNPTRMLGCHLDITERKQADRKFQAFALLGKQLSAAATVQEAAKLIADAADSLLGWDAAALIMFDEKTGLCRSALNVDLVDGVKTHIISDLNDVALTPRMQRVIQRGAELILRPRPDQVDGEFSRFGNKRRTSASLMFVAVRDDQRTVAMFTIQSYRLNAYTTTDLVTLQALADHCGGALARIRSRESQRESESGLATAELQARLGSWEFSFQTREIHWSQGMYALFARNPALGPLTFEEIIPHVVPDHQPVVTTAYRHMAELTAKQSFEFGYTRSDGARCHFTASLECVRNAAGAPIKATGVLQDITIRHAAEEALRRSEQQYAELVNNIDGIVWEADGRTLQMRFVSHQAVRILGYPTSDWITNPKFWEEHIHPEDREAAVAYCATKTKSGADHNLEYRMIAADGRAVWLADFVTVILDQGQPITLRGVLVDITARKQLEQEQARALSLLHATIESSEDGLLVVDRDGRVRIHNERFAELWQIPAALRTNPDDQALLNFVITQLTEPEDFLAKIKYLYAHPNQESFDVLAFKDGRVFERYSRPQRLENEVGGRVWSFRDVTERRSNEHLVQGQARILESIATGLPLAETLAELCRTAEDASPELRCSVLLSDEDGRYLRHGAAPSLPASFCEAVDGIAIGPKACSCGTAAYREAPVIVEDIETDPLWEHGKHLALPHGIRSCWSTPVFSPSREVMGTLAFYYPTRRRPTRREQRIVEMVTHTAAIAILKHRSDEQLTRSRQILRQLSSNLLEAQEAERRHLARELHDELGQTLTATKILLESLQHNQPRPNELTRAHHSPLHTAIGHVETMLQQVRNLSLSLRPTILDDCGLPAALRWLLDQHTKATGRPAVFELKQYDSAADPGLETACFRIAQEALTNISRHSRAPSVKMELQCDAEHLTLVVRDDGQGFDVEQATQRAQAGGSVGLLGQQERAALLGGRVDIISQPGQGTEVRVEFPVTPQKMSLAS